MIRQLINAALLTLCVLLLTVAGHAQSPQLAPAIVAAPVLFRLSCRPTRSTDSERCRFFSTDAPTTRGNDVCATRLDKRDIVMRVVVDARSGAITAVNRVVPLRPDSVVSKMLPPTEPSLNEPLPAARDVWTAAS